MQLFLQQRRKGNNQQDASRNEGDNNSDPERINSYSRYHYIRFMLQKQAERTGREKTGGRGADPLKSENTTVCGNAV